MWRLTVVAAPEFIQRDPTSFNPWDSDRVSGGTSPRPPGRAVSDPTRCSRHCSLTCKCHPATFFRHQFSHHFSPNHSVIIKAAVQYSVNSGSTGVTSEAFYITDQATSSFVMSGGTLNWQTSEPHRRSVVVCLSAVKQVRLIPPVVSFNLETPRRRLDSIFNFRPFPNATYPAFLGITGPSGSGNSLRTSNGINVDFRLLAMVIDAGTTFDIRSIAGTAGNKTHELARDFLMAVRPGTTTAPSIRVPVKVVFKAQHKPSTVAPIPGFTTRR